MSAASRRSGSLPPRSRRFLLLAAAWDLAVAVVLLGGSARPGRADAAGAGAGQDRAVGLTVLAFVPLYALLARRPRRGLLRFSAGAKALGGASGAVAVLRGRRDAVALLSLADAAWLPGFVAAARRAGRGAVRG